MCESAPDVGPQVRQDVLIYQRKFIRPQGSDRRRIRTPLYKIYEGIQATAGRR
jgi:hypothetical protein